MAHLISHVKSDGHFFLCSPSPNAHTQIPYFKGVLALFVVISAPGPKSNPKSPI